MLTTLTARSLLSHDSAIDFPVITMEDGFIVSIEPGEASGAVDILTPAFLDVHVHGAVSHDFMTSSVAETEAVGRFLARRGVGWYLPTTVTGKVDDTLIALERLANAIEAAASGANPQGACPVGIHLEGPFVSHAKRGVHPEIYLQEPSLELFDRFQEAARGHISLMTLAPELPGAIELTQHVTAKGVRVSLGHSDADAAVTEAAIAAGAASATHAFNAMRPLGHREPGILGTVLDRGDVYAELICDGVHVHPSMVRLWLKAKGADRAILITDGMSAAGMPDGTYMLGDLPVDVRDGVCLSGGKLAGSVLTMDRAVANLMAFTRSPLTMAVRLASSNPAHMLGRPELTALTPGLPASFNRYDQNGTLRGTVLCGKDVAASR